MKFSAFSMSAPFSVPPHFKKLFLVMKLTTLMLIIAFLQVSAKGFSQKVTLNEKDAPLTTILQSIKKQTGYFVFYDEGDIKTSKITVQLKEANLDDAMTAILKNQPVAFKIVDKNIFLTAKTPSFLDNIKAAFAAIDVHGHVVDEKGEPLPGVTVKVKGSNQATITNNKGDFIINHLNDNAILTISFIGYESREVNASSNLSKIQLTIATSQLDAVQIIAYGETSQRLGTGDVSSVKSKDIENQPVENPLLALSGRVPGLQITQQSGLSGTAVKVRIQGQNSIANGSDPLYIVDGVPYPNNLLPTVSNILGLGTSDKTPSGAGNPLSFINPQDIESISILKDGDATAIYGSRGANGVILINTKKGKTGQTKADFSLQQGYGEVDRKMNLLNTRQYLAMRRQAYENDGLAIPTSTTTPDASNYDLTLWDPNKNTDWQKVLIGGTAKFTDLHANLSGGNANTSFLVGAGYNRETTVFPGNFADQKGSLHFNLNNTSNNQKFKFALSGSYLLDENHLPGIDLTNVALSLPPNAPELLNPDGTLNWAESTAGSSTWGNSGNPIAQNFNHYDNLTRNLLANSTISYELLNGLILKSNFGYSNLQSNETFIFPLSAIAPENKPYSYRYSLFGTGGTDNVSVEPQINYVHAFNWGKIDLLIGSTYQQTSKEGASIFALGYPSDDVMGDLALSSQLFYNSSVKIKYRYNAVFSRFNYNFQDKYLLNFTIRRDGSSRFGENNQFHNFGSLGGAWIFTNENYLKKKFSFVSFGKLRASYGITGNDQIGDYSYLNLYQSVGAPNTYQNTVGVLPTGLANPYLQWEVTKKLQFGLDIGLSNDRVIISTNYFINKSSNQLLPYSLPLSTGFSSINTNFPATVENSGWELALVGNIVKKENFSWKINANITIPKNKLVAFPGLTSSSYANSLIIGQPLNIIKVYDFAGVDSKTGLYQFLGRDGKLTSNPIPGYLPNNDQTKIINLGQKFYGGIENTISYKDFSLSFLVQFTKQIGANYAFGNGPGYFFSTSGNQPTYILNAWKATGDISKIQAYSASARNIDQVNDAYGSNAGYSDASYIRLKNLSLSWNIKRAWLKPIGVTNLQPFLQGQNLITLTKYKGMDPENQSTGSLPPLRLLTLGIRATL